MNSLKKLRRFGFLLGLMLISICFLSLVSTKAEAQFFSTSQMLNPPCEITLGEGSINNTRSINGTGPFPSLNNPDRPNTADAFSFIERAVGSCYYEMYNEEGFGAGRIAGYGALDNRVRIGSEGADNGGGWRARSMKVFPMQGNCIMVIGDGGVSQYLVGPGDYPNLTGWNFVRSTQGPCTFEVFNGPGFDGRVASYSSGVDGNTRVGWRIRSIRIR